MEGRLAPTCRVPFVCFDLYFFNIADGRAEGGDNWPKHVRPILGKIDPGGWVPWILDGRTAVLGAFCVRLNLWNRTMGTNFPGVVKCYVIWRCYELPPCTWWQISSRLIYVLYVGINSSTGRCRRLKIPTARAHTPLTLIKTSKKIRLITLFGVLKSRYLIPQTYILSS